MKTPPRYQVTRQLHGQEPEISITDAAGVDELVHQAARTGARVHIRPLSDSPDED